MPPCSAQRPPRFLLFPLLFLIFAAALQGCGGDSHSEAEPALRGAAPPAACPGAELASHTTVIYVAPKGVDGDSCGSQPATPCASIAAGIARCGVAGCAVAVRHGFYTSSASIVLRDAVSVHGSCRFGDEPEHFYRTVVAAAPAAGTPAIDASGINSATALTGIVVLGKNETAAGEASIAMRVRASKGLTMSGVTLAAGRGGNGAAGVGSGGGPGGPGGTPANPGDIGYGGQACPSGPPAVGGNGGAGRDINRFGFQGSCVLDCNCVAGASALPPERLPGQASGSARGGASGATGAFGGNCAGRAGVNPTPGDASAGLAGELGNCSAAAGKAVADGTAPGRFAAGRWLAGRGGAGGAGGAGSGGGGGGAGGYSAFLPAVGPVESYYGFAGGGGGGGGCGGAGGPGGQQGGASIALVLIDASIAGLSAGSSLIPGPGGRGGDGGAGARGGPGGAGGKAYNGSKVPRPYVFAGAVFMPGAGAAGGDGGAGGASAGGAGGNGGPSFGIALVGNSPDPGHDAIYPGIPALAGSRGAGGANPAVANNVNSSCRSADGEDGLPAGRAPAYRYEGQS